MADIEAKTGVSELRSGRYGYRPYRRPWEEEKDELDRKIDAIIDRQFRISLLKSLSGSEPQTQMVQPEYVRNPPIVEQLQQEVKTLRDELEKEREARREERLKSIEDSIKELRDEVRNAGERAKDFYSLSVFWRNVPVGRFSFKELASVKRDLQCSVFNLKLTAKDSVGRPLSDSTFKIELPNVRASR